MSTFNIYQKVEFTVMLADSLGLRTTPSGNVVPLLAPKLVHVAPGIYAAHAGVWQPALGMLTVLNRILRNQSPHEEPSITFVSPLGSLPVPTPIPSTERIPDKPTVPSATDIPLPTGFSVASSMYRATPWADEIINASTVPMTYDELADLMSTIMAQGLAFYRERHKNPNLFVRLGFAVTGRYRHPENWQRGVSTTIFCWESFEPYRPILQSVNFLQGPTVEVSKLMRLIMKSQELDELANSGPLAAAQAMEAVHALVAKVSTSVSTDCNILLVGDGVEHTLLKGTMVRLPNDAIVLG